MMKDEEMGEPEHQKKRKKSKEKKKLNMAKPTLSKYIAYLYDLQLPLQGCFPQNGGKFVNGSGKVETSIYKMRLKTFAKSQQLRCLAHHQDPCPLWRMLSEFTLWFLVGVYQKPYLTSLYNGLGPYAAWPAAQQSTLRIGNSRLQPPSKASVPAWPSLRGS